MSGYLKPYAEKTLKTKYRQLGLPEETVELLHKYFSAFAHLYGVLPLKDAYKIINRQNPEIISFEKLYEFSNIVKRERQYYYIVDMDELWDDVSPTPENREIVAEDLLAVSDEYYYELAKMQRGKPLFIPEKDKLLKYEDEYYYEKTPSAIALEQFFIKTKKLTKEKLLDAMSTVTFSLNSSDSMDTVYENLSWSNISFSLDEAITFGNLFTEMNNNFRMQFNRGYTPNELSKLLPKANKTPQTKSALFSKLAKPVGTSSEQKPKTIARNAPCPCGSGKKYKRCCGKDLS